MPISTLHLVTLNTPLPTLLYHLQTSSPPPLLISKVIRWIIPPNEISVFPLVTQNPPWDLLLIYSSPPPSPSDTPSANPPELPPSLLPSISAIYSLKIGIPSPLISNFPSTNAKLLRPEPGTIPALTGSLSIPRIAASAQKLELTEELLGFFEDWDGERAKGAVSMLNLLSFVPGKHAEYLRYGKAFAEEIGRKRGGVAKIVGRVIGGGGEGKAKSGGRKEGKGKEDGNGKENGEAERRKEAEDGWDEIAIAHYPSVWHFADMAASEDYQAVNHRWRVGSLRDTCILMTSELEVPWERVGGRDGRGKTRL